MTIENEIISYSIKRHNAVIKELNIIKKENRDLKDKLKNKEEMITKLVRLLEELSPRKNKWLSEQNAEDERRSFISRTNMLNPNLPTPDELVRSL
tara:strand:+ start:424 stop:708 length:285 start_codon:yes stop_codon:yes gene_type:complete